MNNSSSTESPHQQHPPHVRLAIRVSGKLALWLMRLLLSPKQSRLKKASAFVLVKALKVLEKIWVPHVHPNCNHQKTEETPKESAPENDVGPEVIELATDPFGRAYDKITGQYFMIALDPASGRASVGLGLNTGAYTTPGPNGKLVPWEPPADYTVH